MKRTFVISHAFRQHRSLKLCRGISLIYFTSVRKAITKIWFFTTKGRRHYCTSVQLFIFFNDLKGLILKIRKFLDTGLPTKDKTFETTTCMRCVSYRENYENLPPPQINFPSRGLYFSMWYLYCINFNHRAINIWFDLIWYVWVPRGGECRNAQLVIAATQTCFAAFALLNW